MADASWRAPRPLPPLPPHPGRLRWFLRVLAAFARNEWALLLRYRFSFLSRAVTFALTAVSVYFFSRFVAAGGNEHLGRYGGDFLAFGLVGLLAAELQVVGVSGLGNRIRTAQAAGFLEAELATPAPAWMVLGAAPVSAFTTSALRSTCYGVGAALLFDVRFRIDHPGALALTMLLVVAAFAGLGLLAAASTMLTRRSNPVTAILAATSMFLSGVFYPPSILPPWLASAGQLLPLTHALEALRAVLLLGASIRDVARPLIALTAFAATLAPLGAALFSFALRRARDDGSLTHY